MVPIIFEGLKLAKRDHSLTDNEGALLALVLRAQPITAYQIAKVYDDSPVSNFNTSKGKIYPLIHRLRERGLIRAKRVASDARGTEQLVCTSAGHQAVRAWIKQIRPTHLLLDDPLRTKVQSFELLSTQEQVEWIVDAKHALASKLEELAAYQEAVSVPFHATVHDNAVSSVRSRMDWLDRLLRTVVKSGGEQD
jgi:DNA-binding PadR family transcriptional regulator